MSDPRKQPEKQDGKREALAADIYAKLIVSTIGQQYDKAKWVKEAKEAAEAFYQDELPLPSVPMNKAV